MPLNEYELKWIEDVAGAPVDDEALRKAGEAQTRREGFLQQNVTGLLARKRQQIADAQAVVLTDKTETEGLEKMWRQVRGKSATKITDMPWHVQDQDLGSGWQNRVDLEADTKEDVGKNTQAIPEEQLEALNDALATILESQQQMLQAFDDDGRRMFSDDDIRRELWTPLVRSGLIPENMVPDKFSEEAAAFKGATMVYGEKLKDFSKKSTGKEDLLKGLSIAKDVVGLAATIVSSSITMANAPAIASNTSDIASTKTQIADNKALISGKVGADGVPLTPDQIKALTEQNTALQAHIDQLTIANAALVNQDKYAALSSAVALGGLEIATAGVQATTKKSDEGRWAALVDKTLGMLQGIIVKAVDPFNRIGAQQDIALGSASGVQKVDHANMISGALQAAIVGVRFGPALYQVAKQPDKLKKLALIDELVGKVGDAVGYSIASYATQLDKSDPNAAATMTQTGSAVQSAIKTMGKAPLIYQALENGRAEEAAILLGGGAIQLAFSGASEALFDAVRKDVTDPELREASFAQKPYMELAPQSPTDVAKQEKAQDLGSAATIIALEKEMAALSKTLTTNLAKAKPVELDGTAAAKFQQEIAGALEKKEQAEATKKLQEYFTPDQVEKMFAEFDTKLVGYEDLYANAHPQADLEGQPPEDVEKALEAIDTAIARTSELRARVEILNAVTSATVGVVASFVPGAGAAVAAQKIAFDIYALVKNVEMHNKWCDNMEVAFRAASAYSPAVERTMLGARITMSRTSVKLVLDSLQLGAQIGRCFDPSGGATVASAALTMTQSLVEFGYKMATEVEIKFAWDAYKDALANPGNRKRARKAMRMNSTLAKCAIAYGACMADDPVAKEAIRVSGLSPEILASDKDVCKRLVSYLENELNQDPIVLEVQKSARPWYPADRPVLTPASWFAYKAAATKLANPRLAAASGSTPAIDRTLAALAAADCWDGKTSYAEARTVAAADPTDPTAAIQTLATTSAALLEQLDVAFSGYRPLAAAPSGTPDSLHKDMDSIVKTCQALVKLNLGTARADAQGGGL